MVRLFAGYHGRLGRDHIDRTRLYDLCGRCLEIPWLSFVVLYGWQMITAQLRYKVGGQYSIDSGTCTSHRSTHYPGSNHHAGGVYPPLDILSHHVCHSFSALLKFCRGAEITENCQSTRYRREKDKSGGDTEAEQGERLIRTDNSIENPIPTYRVFC